MTNLTLVIDEEDLKQARILALQQGSSLNAVIRDFIKDYIGRANRYHDVTQRILQKAESSPFSSQGRKWARDDLYER
jgi:hypothetical protein